MQKFLANERYAGTFLYLGVFFLHILPLFLLYKWRHIRFIKVRGVRETIRIIIPLSIQHSAKVLALCNITFASCRSYEVISTTSSLFILRPFIQLYSHFYLCFRYGANVSSHSEDDNTGTIVQPNLLQRFARWYLADIPKYVRYLQIAETLGAIGSLTSVLLLIEPHPDGSPWLTMFECTETQWSPEYVFVGYFVVGGLYAGVCIAISVGISYEFGVVSKEGDHLGVKSLVKRTNSRIIFFAMLTSLAMMASRLGWVDRMPEHALNVIAGACLIYDICYQPLIYVWRNWRDLHITNNILGDSRQMSEFDLLEGFINSSEGYALLLPFFKAELCVEMLLFIREVSAFEANFDDRNMSFSAAQNSDNSRGTQVSSSTVGETATVTLSAAGEAFLQMKVREAIRIFEKFVSPGAPYEINAESGAVTTCKALIQSDNVRSFMKRQNPSPFSEGGRRFSSLRRGRLDSLKVAPDGTNASGSQKRYTNSLELLDLVEDNAGDVGETGAVRFGGKYPLSTRCFSELKIQQIELMLMDLFARFCAADPANGNAWTKYCETQREIERFHTAASRSTNATKQSNNSTVSDKVASSAAYIES